MPRKHKSNSLFSHRPSLVSATDAIRDVDSRRWLAIFGAFEHLRLQYADFRSGGVTTSDASIASVFGIDHDTWSSYSRVHQKAGLLESTGKRRNGEPDPTAGWLFITWDTLEGVVTTDSPSQDSGRHPASELRDSRQENQDNQGVVVPSRTTRRPLQIHHDSEIDEALSQETLGNSALQKPRWRRLSPRSCHESKRAR